MSSKLKVGIVISIIFIALSVVNIFNAMDYRLEAFHFEVKLYFPEKGNTEILFPPLGSISAKTHRTPLKIQLNLKNIDLDLLSKFLGEVAGQKEVMESLTLKINNIILSYISRILLLAFLGGIAAALILRFTKPKTIILSGVLGLLVMGLLLLGTYKTYQKDAFGSPYFTGALKAAPWMVGLAEEAFLKVTDFNEQMEIVANNLIDMFERLEAIESLGSISGDVKVLHVSDIHNNPTSFDLIELVTKEFGVDFIIDTGDLSDFGTALEGIFTSKLEELSIPYVFVPGNHDSPATVENMKKYSKVIILDEQIIDLNGIRIYGLADAASLGYELITSSDEKYPGNLNEVTAFLQKETVNIIAVHRPSVAKKLAGLAPVILHGHDHRQQIQTYKDSIIIDAGTTGAAGIRNFQVLNEIPKTLVLLHFNFVEEGLNLSAADVITLSEKTKRLSLERFLI
ncbi:MAG: metallophosphoesterase [Bacillota bacterium]